MITISVAVTKLLIQLAIQVVTDEETRKSVLANFNVYYQRGAYTFNGILHNLVRYGAGIFGLFLLA